MAGRFWHAACYIKAKSIPLISFLQKKVGFVPQSRPFSICAPGWFLVTSRRKNSGVRIQKAARIHCQSPDASSINWIVPNAVAGFYMVNSWVVTICFALAVVRRSAAQSFFEREYHAA
ncbi:MAG: hypothetical protein A2521_01590 [Deltaproteobacteria bacterium RIFOXYD12_FULL_57_12]|nr:MAG: hypothetical protein A2521_01590 [Deltaproteobacteria bacterium RIFOXYD12_FULL_57_12]